MLKARSLATLFLQSRGHWQQVVFILVSLVAAVFAVADLQRIPLDENRNIFQLAWLSCIPAVFAANLLAPPGQLEKSLPRYPVGIFRVSYAAILALFPVITHVIAQVILGSFDPLYGLWFARNHFLMLGLALLVTKFAPPVFAWIPGSFYLLLCWFLGTKDIVGNPWWWALPNYYPNSILVLVLAVLLLAIGIAWQYPSASKTGD